MSLSLDIFPSGGTIGVSLWLAAALLGSLSVVNRRT
jgi:hypothetical protein